MIMGEFFNEVEFEDTLSPADPRPETVVEWDKDKLETAYECIKLEIEKIKSGTSELTHYAINPSKFGFPFANVIKIFMADPTDKAFEGIESIVRQDLGAKAGTSFTAMIREARKEVPNERK
jgi:hypothetical protein